jgi:hypothetical protein
MQFKVESVQGAHALSFLTTNYSIVASTKNSTGVSSSKASKHNVMKPSDNVLRLLEIYSMKTKSQRFVFYNQFVRFLQMDGIT